MTKTVIYILITLTIVFSQLAWADDSLYNPDTTKSELPNRYQYTGQDNPEFKRVLVPSATEIRINKEYFRICEEELGKFPLDKVDCSDARMIPVTRTLPDGTVTTLSYDDIPPSIPRIEGGDGQVSYDENGYIDNITTCDKPSAIFRDMKNLGCVPGNKIKHIRNTLTNGDVVDWVYACRKNNRFLEDPNLLNELGLIGYNRNTGKTCYFAGQPILEFEVAGKWNYTTQEDGKRVEKTALSATIPIVVGNDIPPPSYTNFDERSVSHWSLPVGGCIGCHSHGPLVRFPFNEPVCLTEIKSGSCLKSFAHLDRCHEYRDKLPRAERKSSQCDVEMPAREPGMLYSAISPFDEGSQLHQFLSQSKEIDRSDSYYQKLMDPQNEWNHPMRLVDEEAKPCTLCHAIGNSTYGDRFAHAAFRLGELKPDDSYHFRSTLFLSNISASIRDVGFHDEKVETLGILPFKIEAKSIEQENAKRLEMSRERYLTAIAHIKKCAQADNNCQWAPHWTIERVEQTPLKYLQDNCSYCHTKGMADPVLVTESDFKHPETAERIILRINDVTPMPPSGKLPEPVREILTTYLRNN